MYSIQFKDGMNITIRNDQDVQVNVRSTTDASMNQLIDKMNDSETDYLRFCVAINDRLKEEVL